MTSLGGMSFNGNFESGQRGNYSNSTLNKCGSFHEGSGSRVLASDASSVIRRCVGSVEIPPARDSLLLDPIVVGDQKLNRLSEAKRALGLIVGGSEGGSLVSQASKQEEVNRFKASILDCSMKARKRIKKLNESLFKVTKYITLLSVKKSQRSERLSNEKTSVSSYLKAGGMVPRTSLESGSQKPEGEAKNSMLSKRVHSSVVSETLAQSKQSVTNGREKDMQRHGKGILDTSEENSRTMDAVGEGWEKKMKKRRTLGAGFTRPSPDDSEAKRTVLPKTCIESGKQLREAESFRGVCEGVNKERNLQKINARSNGMEDNSLLNSVLMFKGKAARTPRTASLSAANPSPSLSRDSAGLEDADQFLWRPKSASYVGQNKRKRSEPAESSSPPVAASWGSQRPHKISRTRRANVVSPVAVVDEAYLPSDCEKVDSKGVAADGRRQGRAARGVTSSRANVAAAGEKRGNASKPRKMSRTAEDKNARKTGRPLKKTVDRKGATRPNKVAMTAHMDSAYESGDDQEELLAAVAAARDSTNASCCGPMWKKIEKIFAPLSSEDVSFLNHELNSAAQEQEDVPSAATSSVPDSNPPTRNERNEADAECLNGCGHGVDREGSAICHLYQRVLSALIFEDDYEEYGADECCRAGSPASSNDSDDRNASTAANRMVNGALCNGRNGFVDPKTCIPAPSPGGDLASFECSSAVASAADEQASLSDKLMTELRILDVHPDPVPDLTDRECQALDRELADLSKKLSQKREQKLLCLNKLSRAAEEAAMEVPRKLEEKAMEKLVETAYKKELATKGAIAAKYGIPKVPKHAAQSFARRTLSRCKEFEESGRSCFAEPALREALLSPPPRAIDESASKEDGPPAAFNKPAAKGKRSARDKAKQGISKPSRKSKSTENPKSPTSTPDNAATSGDKTPPPPPPPPKEAADISELQALDMELDASNQDFTSWFDVDGLPDNDADLDFSPHGLAIPMDDLSELPGII